MGFRLLSTRLTAVLLLGCVALTTLGAAPAEEEREMLRAFDTALTALAYAAAGMCVFSIVWSAFVLMAESTEDNRSGRARNAVFSAIAGLVLALSAKGVSLALLNGLVPFP